MITWSAHLSTLFTEAPYLERPIRAVDAGFGAVETWCPPHGMALAWGSVVVELGLKVTAINAFEGNIIRGERGFLNQPARRDGADAAFAEAVALALKTGCSAIHVLVGRELPNVSRTVQLAYVAAALRDYSAVGEAHGIDILVEAISMPTPPGYLLGTPEAAASLIDEVDSNRLRMLYDAYHIAACGGDPVADLHTYAPYLGHVQYADHPGRGEPGTGTLDLWAFVETLAAVGYKGAIGLEYEPRTSSVESLTFLKAVPAIAPFR
jgi:hydroxypyruvate isomerase